jgi:HemK-related putative methylase
MIRYGLPFRMRTASRLDRRTGLAARLARRAFRWRYRLLHAQRHGRPDLARVQGLDVLVLPGVFHPEFFFASAFFARYLAERGMAAGARVLDMGTGSGILAILMAQRGALVTAIDIHPLAVRCARANARLHGVEERVRALESDLFAALAGERYDLITFHPPFYDRPARDLADRAWAGGAETIRRFLHEAPAHLHPAGELLIAASTEAPYTASVSHAPGYTVRLVAQRELIAERLFLFSLRPHENRIEEAQWTKNRPVPIYKADTSENTRPQSPPSLP